MHFVISSSFIIHMLLFLTILIGCFSYFAYKIVMTVLQHVFITRRIEQCSDVLNKHDRLIRSIGGNTANLINTVSADIKEAKIQEYKYNALPDIIRTVRPMVSDVLNYCSYYTFKSALLSIFDRAVGCIRQNKFDKIFNNDQFIPFPNVNRNKWNDVNMPITPCSDCPPIQIEKPHVFPIYDECPLTKWDTVPTYDEYSPYDDCPPIQIEKHNQPKVPIYNVCPLNYTVDNRIMDTCKTKNENFAPVNETSSPNKISDVIGTFSEFCNAENIASMLKIANALPIQNIVNGFTSKQTPLQNIIHSLINQPKNNITVPQNISKEGIHNIVSQLLPAYTSTLKDIKEIPDANTKGIESALSLFSDPQTINEMSETIQTLLNSQSPFDFNNITAGAVKLVNNANKRKQAAEWHNLVHQDDEPQKQVDSPKKVEEPIKTTPVVPVAVDKPTVPNMPDMSEIFKILTASLNSIPMKTEQKTENTPSPQTDNINSPKDNYEVLIRNTSDDEFQGESEALARSYLDNN
jgi:hypothetical protein